MVCARRALRRGHPPSSSAVTRSRCSSYGATSAATIGICRASARICVSIAAFVRYQS
jgi:hypothetical protein